MSELKSNIEGISLLGNQKTAYPTEYDPSVLEKFENTHPESDDIVSLDAFEWSGCCPKTHQPDFATIYISYIPDKYLVESKSLKLYLFSYRNHGCFHEDVIHQIRNDLVELLQPRYLEIFGDFNSRGGICILPSSIYATPEYEDMKKHRQMMIMDKIIGHKPNA